MDILLHVCCGNCAIFPVKMLRQQHHRVTGYFFNHNIHPYLEFKQRLDTVKEYAGLVDLPMIYSEEYRLEDFLANVAQQPDQRCHYCYQSRMTATARMAAEQGYEGFSTSLLYSRYQQHEAIRQFGEELAADLGLTFVYDDFRSGWNEGINVSKAMGLYRQQYCGCIYSEKDRYYRPAAS
jgi:predicted adenine nucleotide alpha hydrolase (AANH) superfamily ATPase